MTQIPTLRTARLNLRPFRAADFNALAAIFADAEFMRFLGQGRPRDAAETWTVLESMLGQWQLRGYGFFAIESRATGDLLGRAGILHPYDWPEPELAYGIAHPFWGQGYAREAAAAARAWAFDWFGFPRLVSYIAAENTRSQRTAAAIGAVQEGMISSGRLTAQLWVHPAPGHGAVA